MPQNLTTVTAQDRVRVMYTVESVRALRRRMYIGQKVLATHEVMNGQICLEKKDLEATVVGLYPHIVRVRYVHRKRACYQCLTYAQILTERRLVR